MRVPAGAFPEKRPAWAHSGAGRLRSASLVKFISSRRWRESKLIEKLAQHNSNSRKTADCSDENDDDDDDDDK